MVICWAVHRLNERAAASRMRMNEQAIAARVHADMLRQRCSYDDQLVRQGDIRGVYGHYRPYVF